MVGFVVGLVGFVAEFLAEFVAEFVADFVMEYGNTLLGLGILGLGSGRLAGLVLELLPGLGVLESALTVMVSVSC